MYVNRLITNRLEKLAESFPAIVIVGARQVGKSTLVKKVFGHKADYVVFDPVIDIQNARQDPELFLDNHTTPIILDEIQYAPELLPVIKRRIDDNKSPGQYLLTGSQQWGVLKSIAESLAGRAVFVDLEGFSICEICHPDKMSTWLPNWLENDPKAFSDKSKRLDAKVTLYEQLWRGSFPESQFFSIDLIPSFFSGYQRTYIERDVRVIADISNLQLFGRFVRLMSAMTAQEVNFSQLGRELGLTPKTSRRWLDILQHTFQWFEIPPFSGNVIKRISRKSKGYVADTGLACFAQAISSPSVLGAHPLTGALFETFVAAEIRKQCAVLPLRPNIYHWRSHGGAEVDLILERDGIYYPIEIKTKSRPGRGDTTGISAFRKTYPHMNIASGLVIAPTDKLQKISDSDYAIPWDTYSEN